MIKVKASLFFFFFNDTATTEIYTLSLHDALPILEKLLGRSVEEKEVAPRIANYLGELLELEMKEADRKSTRLNSSHDQISYAVFCLKKKKRNIAIRQSNYGDKCLTLFFGSKRHSS